MLVNYGGFRFGRPGWSEWILNRLFWSRPVWSRRNRKSEFRANQGENRPGWTDCFKVFLFLMIFSSVLAVPGVWAGETRLFLLRGNNLHTIDSSNAAILGETRLQGSPDIIHPTPGGKYIFVLQAENGLGQVVDFENPQSTRAVDISQAAPVASLAFSPMGDILYVLGKDSDKVYTYKHKAGVVQYEGQFTIKGARFSGAHGRTPRIALNTRGTRLYSSIYNGEKAGGLSFITVSDKEVVENISGLGGDYSWKMAPGGRMLWGAGPGGWQVVDTSKKKLKAEFRSDDVQLPDFDAKGSRAWALSGAGKELAVFHVRRNKELARISLPEAAQGLGVDGDKGVWLAAEGGLYSLKDVDEGEDGLVRVANLPGEGKVYGFVSVELKSGMGFACF